MLSICSLMSLSISNETFAYSVGREMFSMIQSAAYDGYGFSTLALAMGPRGLLNGNSDRLSEATERIVAEREETTTVV